MGTLSELKLDEIDSEIIRLEKQLPYWKLMAEIWSLGSQLNSVKGELVPDDWTPETSCLQSDNTGVIGHY